MSSLPNAALQMTLRSYPFPNPNPPEPAPRFIPPRTWHRCLRMGYPDLRSGSWNNAPLAHENISGTWVQPRDYSLPDQIYQWNVARAVAQAYANGEPLRLALYSADGERHTGKYFWSSDFGDWNALSRPSLQVVLGTPCDAPDIDCHFLYIPLAKKYYEN